MTTIIRGMALAICSIALVASVLRVRRPGTFPLASLLRTWFCLKPSLAQCLQAVAAGVAMVVVVPLIGLWGGWSQLRVIDNVSWNWLALAVSGAAVKAAYALCEELIFRGALFSQTRRWTGPVAAVGLSALVFAAAHGGRSAIELAILFVDGIGFAGAFHATGGLWIPVVWHFAKNLSVWAIYGHGTIDLTRGPMQVETGGPEWAFGCVGKAGWLDLGVAIAIVALVLASLYSRRAKESWTPPAEPR